MNVANANDFSQELLFHWLSFFRQYLGIGYKVNNECYSNIVFVHACVYMCVCVYALSLSQHVITTCRCIRCLMSVGIACSLIMVEKDWSKSVELPSMMK